MNIMDNIILSNDNFERNKMKDYTIHFNFNRFDSYVSHIYTRL